jgi:hypothetical protein
MRRFVITVVTAALALMGISAPASAQGVDRPFKGTFTGGTTGIVFAPGFDLANPDLSITSTFGGRCPTGASWVITKGGTGRATHLGRLSWTSTHCTLLTSLDPPNAVIYAGELTFTAANGDLLHETYEATGGLVLEGDRLCADTAATFGGGTGRFENASGSALEHGCWPASIQGPVITDLVVTTLGRITY